MLMPFIFSLAEAYDRFGFCSQLREALKTRHDYWAVIFKLSKSGWALCCLQTQ
jgi:hypothetical protein